MIRVTVAYPALEGERFDHDYFRVQHRTLIEQRLKPHGLQAVQMDCGAGQRDAAASELG